MKDLEIKAYAKINFAIDVLRKREDGYHDVKMIMQTIDIFDRIKLVPIKEDILIECDDERVPVGEDNIAYKAAKILFERFNLPGGIKIYINKNIPISAGLAGGSTDAATVLRGINRLYKLGLTKGELMDIGKEIGADVPYCITGNTALAEGIGERITTLPNMQILNLVLVKPKFGVSTAEVYRNFDEGKVIQRPNYEALINGIIEKDIYIISKNMINVLETVTEQRNPIISDIKLKLKALGALGVLMSGSGPSVYAIFSNKDSANMAYKNLKETTNYQCFLTETICFEDY